MNVPIKSETITAVRALAGRVSLVTGSTSGIGLGIARALAAAGSEIVLNGLGTPESIAEAQAQIASEFNVRVLYSATDMAKPVSIRKMIETALASFGRLDVLVNNAGVQYVAPLQEFPPEKWDAILAINLSSAFHTSRLVLPSMFDHKWGRIINIASAHGLVGSPFKIRLCRCQAWNCRADQSHGTGDCRTRRHLQCHLSRLRLYAPGRGAD